MRRVIVDTSGFFALLDNEDRHHSDAAVTFSEAHRRGDKLITTNTVVVECHSLMLARSRAGMSAGLRWLDFVDRGHVFVERVLVGDESLATEVIRVHRDKAYTLCDAISFVVAERLNILHAIAYDRHFREWGRFTLL